MVLLHPRLLRIADLLRKMLCVSTSMEEYARAMEGLNLKSLRNFW